MNWARGLFRGWVLLTALWVAFVVVILSPDWGRLLPRADESVPPLVVVVPGGGALRFAPSEAVADIEAVVEGHLARIRPPAAGSGDGALRAEARRLVEEAMVAQLLQLRARGAEAEAVRRDPALGRARPRAPAALLTLGLAFAWVARGFRGRARSHASEGLGAGRERAAARAPPSLPRPPAP